MKFIVWFTLVTGLAAAPQVRAETNLERGKRVVDAAIAALGGDRFLNLRDRVESGRSYSFSREQVTGLSIAKIYTRYLSSVTDTANTLAVEERDYYGKKEETSVLFTQEDAYELTFRGARPIAGDRFARYKESTLRNFFYILRVRLHEPGMVFESRGADVLDNRPVEIVDVSDAQNRITTVYFDQTSKLPVRQLFLRRDAVTKDKDQEITEFSKYKDLGGGIQWPFDVHRERNGEKIYEMFSESGEGNKNISDDKFRLPANIKVLKKT